MLAATRNDAVLFPATGDQFTLFTGNDHGIFRVAVETSPAGTVVCDEAFTILFSNRRIEAIFGYPPGALVGSSIDALIPEARKDATGPEVRAFGEAQVPAGTSVLCGLRRDGSEVPVEVARTSIARNGRRFVIISLVDATERARPENHATAAAMNAAGLGPLIGDRPTTSNAARFDRHRPRVASGEDRARLRRPANLLKPGQVVAEGAAARCVLAQIEQVAATNATVLLTGETGSGKEVFADAIHNLSARYRRPMVRVNCAAIPAGLLESELFGHERGAYTGALAQQIGRFEAADRSTIFLDEIGELSLDGQVKLLRVLQSKEVERLGGNRPIKVDVRIIVATNRDLERAIEEREFREDLYYRLSVFPIHVPPLRERTEDIPVLVWTFIDEIANACGKRVDSISEESMAALQRYTWPGNVRELRNVIERTVIVATGPHLNIEPPRLASGARANTLRLDDIEGEHIRAVLDKAGWRIRGAAGAADLLGLKPTTLESRMVKLGICRSASLPRNLRDALLATSVKRPFVS
jgi:PAS domain S-box-containing protein